MLNGDIYVAMFVGLGVVSLALTVYRRMLVNQKELVPWDSEAEPDEIMEQRLVLLAQWRRVTVIAMVGVGIGIGLIDLFRFWSGR